MTTSRLTTADERKAWLATAEQAVPSNSPYCLIPAELLYRVLQDADRELKKPVRPRKTSAAPATAPDQLHLELPE